MQHTPWREFFIVWLAYDGRPSHPMTGEDHDLAVFDTEDRAREWVRKLHYDDAEYFIVKYTLAWTSDLQHNEGGHPWPPLD